MTENTIPPKTTATDVKAETTSGTWLLQNPQTEVAFASCAASDCFRDSRKDNKMIAANTRQAIINKMQSKTDEKNLCIFLKILYFFTLGYMEK